MFISGAITAFFVFLAYDDDPGFLVIAAIAFIFFCYSVQDWEKENDKTEKLKRQNEAARGGEEDSQYRLGLRYETGDNVKEDKEKAFYWYEQAAEQGHAQAQNNLGKMYEMGEGTVENYKEAFKWYEKSIKNECADAQYNFGRICCSGKGSVKKNLILAYAMILLASSSGHRDAIATKQNLKKSLNDEQIEKGQELALKIKSEGIKI